VPEVLPRGDTVQRQSIGSGVRSENCVEQPPRGLTTSPRQMSRATGCRKTLCASFKPRSNRFGGRREVGMSKAPSCTAIGTSPMSPRHVTNVTKPSEQLGENWNFVLLRVRIEGHEHRHARIATSGFRERVYQQFTPIPAGKMAQADADLLFFPAIADGTEPLLVDVIFTDNYGQEYRVPSKFRCILPRSPKP
jgi:hypothetical protein